MDQENTVALLAQEPSTSCQGWGPGDGSSHFCPGHIPPQISFGVFRHSWRGSAGCSPRMQEPEHLPWRACPAFLSRRSQEGLTAASLTGSSAHAPGAKFSSSRERRSGPGCRGSSTRQRCHAWLKSSEKAWKAGCRGITEALSKRQSNRISAVGCGATRRRQQGIQGLARTPQRPTKINDYGRLWHLTSASRIVVWLAVRRMAPVSERPAHWKPGPRRIFAQWLAPSGSLSEGWGSRHDHRQAQVTIGHIPPLRT